MNNDLEQKRSIKPFFERFRLLLHDRIGGKETPLVLVQGGFGKNNTGDDTLLRVAKEQILEAVPQARVIALCHKPELLKESYGIDGVRFQSFRTFKLLFSCDALILASGGLVNNIDFRSVWRSVFNLRGKFTFITAWLMILRKKITVAFGVGVHEVPDPIVRFLMKRVLPRMSLVCVRDKYSVGIMESLGVKDIYFAHDPAIAFSAKEVPVISFPPSPYYVFNFRETKDREESERVKKEFVHYFSCLHQQSPEITVLLLPFSIHPSFALENDVLAMRDIYTNAVSQYGASNLLLCETYQTAERVKELAKEAKWLILTRHHAPVLTYSCQIPTIVISYNFKCREFAELAEYEHIMDYQDVTADRLLQITHGSDG